MPLFDMSPQDQGLLSMALSLMANSGPSAMPRPLGASLGQAGLVGLQNMDQAKQHALLDELRKMQIAAAQQEAKRKAIQAQALSGIQQASAPQALGPQAMNAGAAVGDIGPTMTNLKRLDALEANPVRSQYTPVGLDKLQQAAVAGVNIDPFLKLNEAAQPKTETVDTGNEILVRDPRTNQVIQRLPKGAAPGAIPSEFSDLSPTQQRDFILQRQQAGAARQTTNVNTQLPASEEAQRDFMKSTRANYDALRNAPQTLKNIEDAKALIPQAKGFMGPGGQSLLEATKFMNNRLGTKINPEGVKSAEELQSRLFMGIMDNLKKMDAQPSEMQQKVMMDALGKLGTDPNALPRVLDAYGDVVREKVDIHNNEVSGAVKRGVKFPYDPTINLPAKPEIAPSPVKAAPTRGQVVDGWEFLGGDPANKMNWRKR